MVRSKGTKRARARAPQESKSEHPSKKVCESKPGSETISTLSKKRARFEEDDLEEVEPPSKKLCEASGHPKTAELPAGDNTDELFEAVWGQAESIAVHKPISTDLGLTSSIVARDEEKCDDEVHSNDLVEDIDGDAPVGPLVAYKPDLDFDAELEAALEEASDVEGDKPVGPLVTYKPDLDFDAELGAASEKASDTGSQPNEGQNDEPGDDDESGDDFEAELEAAFEREPEALTQLDGSLCLDQIGSAQADKSLAEPTTPQSKASVTEGAPSPKGSSITTPSTGCSKSSPRTVDSTASTPDRSSGTRPPIRTATANPPHSGLSFKDRRPVTAQDRMSVANAISWTYADLYRRTEIDLDRKTKNSNARSAEVYDTTQESFSYQYGYVQHRYKSYMEVKDSMSGRDIGTKAYEKWARRRYEEEDLLDEVEGEWKSFDDWKPPQPKKPAETVDLTED